MRRWQDIVQRLVSKVPGNIRTRHPQVNAGIATASPALSSSKDCDRNNTSDDRKTTATSVAPGAVVFREQANKLTGWWQRRIARQQLSRASAGATTRSAVISKRRVGPLEYFESTRHGNTESILPCVFYPVDDTLHDRGSNDSTRCSR